MLLHNHTTINFMPLLKLPLLNLLSKLDNKQLAWIAGFLDGDGHIGCRIIRRQSPRRQPQGHLLASKCQGN